MSLPKTIALHTVEEYLALERESEERHEYLDGQIYAMAGESKEHADISVNLVSELRSQLKGTPCRVWTKDSKVVSGPAIKHSRSTKGLFSYPDLVVVRDEPRFLDGRQDVLLNPTVIIEVLSPATESFDRGEKFRRYRTQIPSLTDYILVSQALPLIDYGPSLGLPKTSPCIHLAGKNRRPAGWRVVPRPIWDQPRARCEMPEKLRQ